MVNYNVSAILVNYNKSLITIECVNSLLKTQGVNINIIVVDNSTIQSERQLLKDALSENACIICKNENVGYVKGVNAGIAKSLQDAYDYLLILNNDTIIAPDAVYNLCLTAQKYNNKCIVSGKVYNIENPNTLQYIGQWCRSFKKLDYPPYIDKNNNYDDGQWDKEMEMDMIDDIFWLLPIDLVRIVGFYDEDFFIYGEQNDYALRAKERGYKLIYTPTAKIWHYHHFSSDDKESGYPSIQYWKSYSIFLLAYRHLSKVDFLYIVVKGLVRSHLSLLKSMFKKGKNINLKIATIRGQYSFLLWIMKLRHNSGYNPYI